jgi:SAM-dependent methyltransferase
MPQESFQLAGNAAAVYEDQKVPAIFGPLAEATLNAVSLDQSDVILDVACGTGIVARTVRRRLGLIPRIVGVDLNEEMIATARNLGDEASQSCEWHIADVTNMPFDSETFSIAFCQQGIQFFPDEIAALREMKRVLRSKGGIVLSVWSGPSELFKALATALSRHVDEEIGQRALAPFTYGRAAELGDKMSDLGFINVSAQIIVVDRTLADPETSIPKEIMGSPIGPSVAEKGDATMREIVADTIAALSAYRQGSGFIIPQRTHLIEAKAS